MAKMHPVERAREENWDSVAVVAILVITMIIGASVYVWIKTS